MSSLARKVLVLGGKNLMLGKNLTSFFKRDGCGAISSSELDVRSFSSLKQFIYKLNPAVFLNCDAVARNECLYDQVLRHSINIGEVKNLVDVSKNSKLTPIFFSSNSAFPGTTQCVALKEDASPYLESAYGQQKFEAEKIISELSRYYIIRFPLLVGSYQNPNSFVNRIANASTKHPYKASNKRY